jgi:hypothetical protein
MDFFNSTDIHQLPDVEEAGEIPQLSGLPDFVTGPAPALRAAAKEATRSLEDNGLE